MNVETASRIFLSRVPDGNIFCEQLVEVFQHAAKKRRLARTGAAEAAGSSSDDRTPVPTPIKAAGPTSTGTLAVACKKRDLIEGDDGEGGGGRIWSL